MFIDFMCIELESIVLEVSELISIDMEAVAEAMAISTTTDVWEESWCLLKRSILEEMKIN